MWCGCVVWLCVCYGVVWCDVVCVGRCVCVGRWGGGR